MILKKKYLGYFQFPSMIFFTFNMNLNTTTNILYLFERIA